MDKPILLLDIDGTLNPRKTCYSDLSYVECMIDGTSVRVCIDHGTWIDSLTDLYEVTWCSAWGDKANLISEALGLPALSCVPVETVDSRVMNSPYMPTPKLKEVQAYVGDAPFVWVDDLLNDDAHQWVDKRNESIPTLLVEIDSEVGLKKTDIQLIEDFHDYAFGDSDA